MFTRSLLTALAVATAAAAQNITAIDLEGVQANFQQALLVPQFLETFNPQGTLDASWSAYDTGVVSTGQTIAVADCQTEPYLSVTPGSNATDLMGGSSYTIMMVDANYSGADLTSSGQYFHWLEYNVALPSGSSPIQVPRNQQATIPYVGPAPPPGSGSHRYVLMVWSQPSGFQPPSQPTGFGNYNFKDFLSTANLGTLVAAQYFQAVNGTSTVSASATSSVDTTTLAGAAAAMSMTSGAMSGSASGTASGSGSATRASGSAAASSSAPASAGEKTVVMTAGGLVAALFGAVMML